MSEFDGGAAFPIVHPDGLGVQYYGMSLRDYFAAKAMQGMISQDVAFVYGKDVAACAYEIADAMLKERAK